MCSLPDDSHLPPVQSGLQKHSPVLLSQMLSPFLIPSVLHWHSATKHYIVTKCNFHKGKTQNLYNATTAVSNRYHGFPMRYYLSLDSQWVP